MRFGSRSIGKCNSRYISDKANHSTDEKRCWRFRFFVSSIERRISFAGNRLRALLHIYEICIDKRFYRL